MGPGTYDEKVIIRTENLTLRSTDGAEATIVAGTEYGAIWIIKAGAGATIDGFTTTTEGKGTGIFLNNGAENCIIENNIASNNFKGIYLSWSGNCILRNNVCSNNTYANGISLSCSDDCIIENNVAENNNESGICLYSSENCTVKNNIAKNNTAGIYLWTSSDGCMLENNLASDNQGHGIRIISSNNNKVVNNTVTLNSDDGIKVQDHWGKGSSNNVVEKNNINGNSEWGGIHITNRLNLNNTVQYNNIYNNTAGGLLNENPYITVNATCNWWGHFSGPSGAGTGSGDAVSANVDFNPWLLDPAPYGVCGSVTRIEVKIDPDPMVLCLTGTGTPDSGTIVTTAYYSDGSSAVVIPDLYDGYNTGVVSVDVDGNVSSVGLGTTTITVHFKDKTADIPVEVKDCIYLVEIDIKPQSCPNPLNVNSKGVLPVAILGTDDFDVTNVDPDSVRLKEVEPSHWAFEDVATYEPMEKIDCYDCSTAGPDGIFDLILHFNTQEIVLATGEVEDGDCIALTLAGNLLDGIPIKGEDSVLIIKKGKP